METEPPIRPVGLPTTGEVRRWLIEHGRTFRAEQMEALLDGNDVACHWSGRVLAMLDSVEALVEEADRYKAALTRIAGFARMPYTDVLIDIAGEA